MSSFNNNTFSSYSASSCFAKFKESSYASDYITKKKIKNSFCTPKICYPNRSVYSESNLLMFKTAKRYTANPYNEINKTQLYINLITKLQLNNDIRVITDNANQQSPALIEPTQNPVTRYTIDISGNLFGNNSCTINNWENYIVYNTKV